MITDDWVITTNIQHNVDTLDKNLYVHNKYNEQQGSFNKLTVGLLDHIQDNVVLTTCKYMAKTTSLELATQLF